MTHTRNHITGMQCYNDDFLLLRTSTFDEIPESHYAIEIDQVSMTRSAIYIQPDDGQHSYSVPCFQAVPNDVVFPLVFYCIEENYRAGLFYNKSTQIKCDDELNQYINHYPNQFIEKPALLSTAHILTPIDTLHDENTFLKSILDPKTISQENCQYAQTSDILNELSANKFCIFPKQFIALQTTLIFHENQYVFDFGQSIDKMKNACRHNFWEVAMIEPNQVTTLYMTQNPIEAALILQDLELKFLFDKLKNNDDILKVNQEINSHYSHYLNGLKETTQISCN